MSLDDHVMGQTSGETPDRTESSTEPTASLLVVPSAETIP